MTRTEDGIILISIKMDPAMIHGKENAMKEYKELAIEVLPFAEEDVITASGVLMKRLPSERNLIRTGTRHNGSIQRTASAVRCPLWIKKDDNAVRPLTRLRNRDILSLIKL